MVFELNKKNVSLFFIYSYLQSRDLTQWLYLYLHLYLFSAPKIYSYIYIYQHSDFKPKTGMAEGRNASTVSMLGEF